MAFRSAGGTAESVVHGVTGLLADDDDSFLKSVERIVADADLRQRMSDAATAYAQEFSWERTAREVEAVLRSAADRRHLS